MSLLAVAPLVGNRRHQQSRWKARKALLSPRHSRHGRQWGSTQKRWACSEALCPRGELTAVLCPPLSSWLVKLTEGLAVGDETEQVTEKSGPYKYSIPSRTGEDCVQTVPKFSWNGTVSTQSGRVLRAEPPTCRSGHSNG